MTQSRATRSRKIIRRLALFSAALLIGTACSGGSDDEPVEADTPQLPASTKLGDGMWSGRLEGTDAFVAIVSGPNGGVVYFCDDGNIAEWFRADSIAENTALVNPAGSVVTLSREGDGLRGSVSIASLGQTFEFTAAPSETSPLQRSYTLTEDLLVNTGWITLPDGETRGSMSATSRSGKGSSQAQTTTTTKAPGGGAKPVTQILPAPPASTTSVIQANVPGGLVNLAPANPLTPDTMGAPTRNRPIEFVWTALGDSYASGEGAPVRNGGVDLGQARPFWGPAVGDVTLDERQSCHRSDAAGAPLANGILVQEFPEVTFQFRHYACSGAKSDNLMESGYIGPDRTVQVPQPAQVDRAAAFAGGFASYDAMYLNIGGNDSGFGPVIVKCLSSAACQNEIDSIEIDGDTLAARLRSLPDRYVALDDYIMSFTDARGRRISPSNILITKYPDIISTDGGACGDGIGSSAGDVTALISREEAAWARDFVLAGMNEGVGSTSELGWIVVDGHLDDFRGRGFCTTRPMANTNNAALAMQGDDFTMVDPVLGIDVRQLVVAGAAALGSLAGPVAAVAAGIAAAQTVKLSSGILHPNRDGYRAYGNAIAEDLRPLVLGKMNAGLETPRRVRPVAAAPGGDITFRWDDMSTTEARYEVTMSVIEGSGTLTTTTATLPAESQEYVVKVSGRAAVRLDVKACVRDFCTAAATGEGANFAPNTPTGGGGAYNAVKVVGGRWVTSVMAGWTKSPYAVGYLFEFRTIGGSKAQTFTAVVRDPVAGLAIKDPNYQTAGGAPKARYAVRVSACSRAGCSPFTAEIQIDATAAARETDLSRQKLTSSPVPLAAMLVDERSRLSPTGFGPALPGEEVPGSGAPSSTLPRQPGPRPPGP